MHTLLVYAAITWMSVLLVVGVIAVIRTPSTASRIVALDMVVLIITALLVLFSSFREVSYYLDAALILALLSFVATLAASRYYGEGRVFS